MYPAVYPDALQKICTQISFDQDVKVQVFEMTIRALGSLLSTYQYLDRLPDTPKEQAKAIPGLGPIKVDLKQYRGRILELAVDLGNRMMPAFETQTGLPYARVNLRHGVEAGETTDTCKLDQSVCRVKLMNQVPQERVVSYWNSPSFHVLREIVDSR